MGPGAYQWVDNTVVYKGAELKTNQWGLRDREYDKVKAPGTYRIAILGSSHVVGVGVNNDQTFENLVENNIRVVWPTLADGG